MNIKVQYDKLNQIREIVNRKYYYFNWLCHIMGLLKGGLNQDTLPKVQVQEPQFTIHISYFLQKCKKGKAQK